MNTHSLRNFALFISFGFVHILAVNEKEYCSHSLTEMSHLAWKAIEMFSRSKIPNVDLYCITRITSVYKVSTSLVKPGIWRVLQQRIFVIWKNLILFKCESVSMCNKGRFGTPDSN